MKKENTFKFIVSGTGPATYSAVYAKYPTISYIIKTDRWKEASETWQIQAALDALKVALIQEIVNAEFEFEK